MTQDRNKGRTKPVIAGTMLDLVANTPLVRKLAEKWGIKRTILLDIYQVTAKKYIPTLAVPATFLIKDGFIKYGTVGYKETTLPELEKELKKLRSPPGAL